MFFFLILFSITQRPLVNKVRTPEMSGSLAERIMQNKTKSQSLSISSRNLSKSPQELKPEQLTPRQPSSSPSSGLLQELVYLNNLICATKYCP